MNELDIVRSFCISVSLVVGVLVLVFSCYIIKENIVLRYKLKRRF